MKESEVSWAGGSEASSVSPQRDAPPAPTSCKAILRLRPCFWVSANRGERRTWVMTVTCSRGQPGGRRGAPLSRHNHGNLLFISCSLSLMYGNEVVLWVASLITALAPPPPPPTTLTPPSSSRLLPFTAGLNFRHTVLYTQRPRSHYGDV